MLVLTRKVGQSITIGKNVVICVQKCSRGCVKLSISAPKEIKILREELAKTTKV